MVELPKEAQMSYQELFPEEFAAEELKSTLKAPERQVIWDIIRKLETEISNLKGIVQNPMPLTHQDLSEWSINAGKLSERIIELQQKVIMLASGRI